jgi:hypothetical protein
MINQFHFKGFEADEGIKLSANRTLGRLMDRAPYDSNAVALLEKDESGYRCSIDIYSRQGPFMANVHRETVSESLRAIERRLKTQIEWWWSHRSFDHPSSFEVENIYGPAS